MDTGDSDTHALGYRRVDEDRNVPVLVDTMDATGRWPATKRLRGWVRQNLRLTPGERLIDVGCGPGDAALEFAQDLGPDGEIVGIDASEAMLDVARHRASATTCRTRFSHGDALGLDEATGTFDAARSERTLQWLSNPDTAVAEMARVLRPEGRMALIDTDWSTLRLDIGDDALAALVHETMRVERRRASNVGGRLTDLVLSVGFDDVIHATATHVWNAWDPDLEPAPDGCFSMRSVAEDLVSARRLDRDGAATFVTAIHDAARNGHFSMSLTMYAVVATRARPLA